MEDLTLGESVVLRLCETVDEKSHIFFDRYFTTIHLLDMLRSRNLGITGTVMANRVPKSQVGDLMADKDMKKEPRGTSDEIFKPDGNVVLVKWFDLKPIPWFRIL